MVTVAHSYHPKQASDQVVSDLKPHGRLRPTQLGSGTAEAVYAITGSSATVSYFLVT